MNIKNNQRTQNTKNSIKEVFFDLLTQKEINEISVQEICKKASINRTTFYAHFDDVEDLMQKILDEKEQEIRIIFKDLKDGAYKPVNEQSLQMLLEYIQKNSVFYKKYLNDFRSTRMIDYSINASWSQFIEPILNSNKKKTNVTVKYQFEYFKSGLIGVTRSWLNADCKESPQELTSILKNLIIDIKENQI